MQKIVNNSLLLCFVSLALSACVVNREQQLAHDASLFSVISATQPGFQPREGDSFSWYENLLVVDSEAKIRVDEEERMIIQGKIQEQMLAKGFRLAAPAEQSTYTLGAALLLDDSEESQRIKSFVKAFPSLTQSIKGYDHGTLLVVIAPTGKLESGDLLWRGAIRAYVIPEGLPIEVQTARVDGYVRKLLSSIPQLQ